MPFQWWEHFVLNIYLHGAPLLPLTQGLDALKTVGGQLYLKGNGEMMGLGGGLGALESVGSAVLTNNGNTQVSMRMRYLTRVYLHPLGRACRGASCPEINHRPAVWGAGEVWDLGPSDTFPC